MGEDPGSLGQSTLGSGAPLEVVPTPHLRPLTEAEFLGSSRQSPEAYS